MAQLIVMPKLNATMEEGVIDTWLVEEGQAVKEGDPIVEVQTDKITMEVEAESTGKLLKRVYEEGDTVPVQKAIAVIGDSVDELEGLELDTSAESSSPEGEETEPVLQEK